MIQLSIDDYVESIRSRTYTLNEMLSLFNDVFRLGQYNKPGDKNFKYYINRHIIFWEHYFDNFVYRCCYHMYYTGHEEEITKLNEIIKPSLYQKTRLYSFYEMMGLLREVYNLGILVHQQELFNDEPIPLDTYYYVFYKRIKELNLNEKLDKPIPFRFELKPSNDYIMAWNNGH